MKSILRTLFFCTLFYNTAIAQTNDLKFERITNDDGLESKYAEFFFRDSRDFIWFNSIEGLQIYDGLEVQAYKKRTKSRSGLSSSFIQGDFFEDTAGYLWFGTYAGLERFDPVTEEAITFLGKDTSDYHLFYLQNDSLLWLQANQAIYTYNIKQDSFIHKANTNSKRFCINPKDGKITTIIGLPWINENGIELYEVNEDLEVNLVKQDLLDKGLFNSGSFKNETEAWLVSNRGLYYYNLEHGIIDSCHLPNTFQGTHYTQIFQLTDSLLLFGEISSGLWEFNTNSQQLIHQSTFHPDQEKVNDLSSNSISGIYVDHEDLLWIGYSQYPKIDFTWIHNNKFKNLLSGENANVRSLVQDHNQHIWVGTANRGLYKIAPSSNTFIQYPNFGTTIDQVFIDKAGQLFLIAENKVYQYDFTSETWHLFYDFGEIKPVRMAGGLGEEKYFCTISGIFKLSKSPQNNKLVKQAIDTTFKSVFYVFQPLDSLLVFPGLGTGKIKILSLQPNGTIVPSEKEISPEIEDIIYDKKRGYFWLATSEGLFTSSNLDVLEPIETVFFNPTNVVSLTLDQENNLWLSGADKLWRYSPEEDEAFWAFSRADELELEIFSSQTSLITSSGYLLVGGANGLVSMHIEHISPFQKAPSIYLKVLTVNDETIPPHKHPISLSTKLSLPSKENTLRFTLKMPTHYLADNATIYYRLAGKDRSWSRKPNDGQALKFEQLAPGDYTLEIFGRNANGLKGPHAKFYFLIKKPIQQRAWFIGLVILIIGAMAYFFYWNELRKYKARRQAMDQERNRIQSELHDDVGSTLSRIRYLSDPFLLGEMPDEMKNNFEKILHAAIEGTDSMYDIIWALNPENNSLESLIEKLQKLVYDFSIERSITPLIDVPEEGLSLSIGSVKRRHLFLIVKEALNNIGKYAGATEVKFSLHVLQSNKRLELIIHDNGSGISDEKLKNKTGNGLRNIYSRVENMGGVCKITNESGVKIWVMVSL